MIMPNYDLPTKQFVRAFVNFEQGKCSICQEDFKENELIVELACQHIFHPQDLSTEYIACPLCKRSIESRNRQFSRAEIDQLVDSLFQKVVRYFPKPVSFAQSFLHMDFSVPKKFFSDSLENYQKQPKESIFKHSSWILNLELFNKFLDNFANQEAFQNNRDQLLASYKEFLIERIQNEFNEIVITKDNYHSFEKIANRFIELFKIVLHKADLIIDFCETLKVETSKDQRIVGFFQQRKERFIELNREFFQNKNLLRKSFAAKGFTAEGYTKEQIIILSENVSGFKAAHRLNCIIRIAKLILVIGILHRFNLCDLTHFRSRPILNFIVTYYGATRFYSILQDLSFSLKTSNYSVNRSVEHPRLP